MAARPIHDLLPHAVPASAEQRLLLYAIRRMAAGGIGDAHAAQALLGRFGINFRRPLVLLRALVSEISNSAATRLVIGPCCCPRMSASEEAMLTALRSCEADPARAHERLASLLNVRTCAAVLASATALAGCFSDLGAPLARPQHDCI